MFSLWGSQSVTAYMNPPAFRGDLGLLDLCHTLVCSRIKGYLFTSFPTVRRFPEFAMFGKIDAG
uniref:Uncharacterized protein n=1 Tax=Arundo donax TaxID=35708 RepID=A0A0A9DPW3_ARUDO